MRLFLVSIFTLLSLVGFAQRTTYSVSEIRSKNVKVFPVEVQGAKQAAFKAIKLTDILDYSVRKSGDTMSGGLAIGAGTLVNRNLSISRPIAGGSTSYSIYTDAVVQSGVSSIGSYIETNAGTAAGSYTLPTLRHFAANQGTIGAGSIVTNQYAFYVSSSLTGAANNYGFYSNLASSAGRWNLYMNGTAGNYMGGSLGIGANSLNGYNLKISRNIGGAVWSYGVMSDGVVQADVAGGKGHYYSTWAATAAGSYTLNNLFHYAAFQGSFGAGSTTSAQYGLYVDQSLVSATNNYGVYSAIPAGTGRWNLFAPGTANNHLNGPLLIGTSVSSGYMVDVVGNARVSGNQTAAKFYVSALNTAPSSPTDTGSFGEIRFCSDGVYFCIATNTWTKAALSGSF